MESTQRVPEDICRFIRNANESLKALGRTSRIILFLHTRPKLTQEEPSAPSQWQYLIRDRHTGQTYWQERVDSEKRVRALLSLVVYKALIYGESTKS